MHIGKKDYIIQRALVIFSSSATSFFSELTYVQKNKSKQERKEQIPSRQSCFLFNNCNESTDYSCSCVTRIKWVLFNWPLLYCLVKSLRLIWCETERFRYIFAEIDQIWRAAELKKNMVLFISGWYGWVNSNFFKSVDTEHNKAFFCDVDTVTSFS